MNIYAFNNYILEYWLIFVLILGNISFPHVYAFIYISV